MQETLRNFSKVAYGITDDACGEEIVLKVCACLCWIFLWHVRPWRLLQKLQETLRNFSKVVYGITDDAGGEEIA